MRGKQRASKEGFPGEGTTRTRLERPVGASRCMGVTAGLMGSEGQRTRLGMTAGPRLWDLGG